MSINPINQSSASLDQNTFIGMLTEKEIKNICLNLPVTALSNLSLVYRDLKEVPSNDNKIFWGHYFSHYLQQPSLPVTPNNTPSTFEGCCDYYKRLTSLHNKKAKEFMQKHRHTLHINKTIQQVVSQFPFISSLDLFCTQISDLEPLKALSSLTKLVLSGCTDISDLDPLKNLASLTELRLNYCDRITNLDPLKDLSSLTKLNLRGCIEVSDLEPLKNLSSLTELDLRGCPQLSDNQIDTLRQQNSKLNIQRLW